MRSMTGYGRGVVERGEVRATVEVRAVNHRFLDLKVRGAPGAIEDELATRVRLAIGRGAVVVSVNLVRGGAIAGMRIDPAAAERAHRVLSELAARLALPGPDLALVLAQPGVVTSEQPPDDDTEGAAAVLGALAAALAQLDTMRAAEGAALAAELTGRLDELTAMRAQVAVLAAAVPPQLARRLLDRVKRLADEAGVDPARIAQEVALLADRADITEELVRLASHLDQARALVGGDGAVGRRLDFLVQEIGRELNTIGSKSTAAEITTAIVGAKATLEKVREQTQNVE
jgi:uncharacterized protein (TIGR00255 family)